MKDWIGAFVPGRTPPHTIERLNVALRAAARSAAVRDTYAALMIEPGGESPAESARMARAEFEMWRPIVEASGFVAND